MQANNQCCIDQLIVMLAYWPVGAYMAPFSDSGLFAQGGSAGIARLQGIPAHVGPSQQGGGPPRPWSIPSEAFSRKLGGAMLQYLSALMTRHRLVLSFL